MFFYADENFPLDVSIELRRLGNDVLTAFEDGRANRGIEDEKVLRRATKLNRAVLTINRVDFKKTSPIKLESQRNCDLHIRRRLRRSSPKN